MATSPDATDLDHVETILERILRAAGEILRQHFQERSFQQTPKSGVDLTTTADEEADALLRGALVREFPDAAFLTEETAPPDWSLFRDAEEVWVIDPLDGTNNFSRGTPYFGISVARVSRGRPSVGAIYEPMSGNLYSARVDRPGARKNGALIHVSRTQTLRESVISCDWGWDLAKRAAIVRVLGALCTEVRQIRCAGSAVAELANLAAGRTDAYLHSDVKPWDVAAAGLIVAKANGTVTTLDGRAWDPFETDILAATSSLHPLILRVLAKATHR